MVNLNPRDPRDHLAERERAEQTRPQYRDPNDTNLSTYFIGGAAAVLFLIGILWAATNDAPNQQSAANQPPPPPAQVERPADRTQPEVPPAPSPAPPAP